MTFNITPVAIVLAFSALFTFESQAANDPVSPSIASFTIAASPANRTRLILGIGEEVKLTFMPAGNAQWKITKGKGMCPELTATSVIFTAPDDPDTTTITATSSDPNVGTATITFITIAPSGVLMEKTNEVPINSPSLLVSMICTVYVTPDNVNFEKISVMEFGVQNAIVDAKSSDPLTPDPDKYFYVDRNITHSGLDSFTGMNGHVEGKGTKMREPDNPQMTTRGAPYSEGFLKFLIPWHYKIGGVEKGEFAHDIEQKATLTVDGSGFRLTLTKAGAEAHVNTL